MKIKPGKAYYGMWKVQLDIHESQEHTIDLIVAFQKKNAGFPVKVR